MSEGVRKVLEHGDQAYNGRDPPICEPQFSDEVTELAFSRNPAENGPFQTRVCTPLRDIMGPCLFVFFPEEA